MVHTRPSSSGCPGKQVLRRLDFDEVPESPEILKKVNTYERVIDRVNETLPDQRQTQCPRRAPRPSKSSKKVQDFTELINDTVPDDSGEFSRMFSDTGNASNLKNTFEEIISLSQDFVELLQDTQNEKHRGNFEATSGYGSTEYAGRTPYHFPRKNSGHCSRGSPCSTPTKTFQGSGHISSRSPREFYPPVTSTPISADQCSQSSRRTPSTSPRKYFGSRGSSCPYVTPKKTFHGSGPTCKSPREFYPPVTSTPISAEDFTYGSDYSVEEEETYEGTPLTSSFFDFTSENEVNEIAEPEDDTNVEFSRIIDDYKDQSMSKLAEVFDNIRELSAELDKASEKLSESLNQSRANSFRAVEEDYEAEDECSMQPSVKYNMQKRPVAAPPTNTDQCFRPVENFDELEDDFDDFDDNNDIFD